MLKFIINVIKKISFAFVLLYGINLIMNSLNVFIPINIPTLTIISLLGAPGLLSLFVISFFL